GRAPVARLCALVLAAAAAATIVLRAEIPDWIRDVEANGRFHDALFRSVAMPGGPVEVRRAPADAHEALTRAAPGDAPDREWLALRARAAEEMLDAAAADADWKSYASASSDAGAGQLALADFYHRHLQPAK